MTIDHPTEERLLHDLAATSAMPKTKWNSCGPNRTGSTRSPCSPTIRATPTGSSFQTSTGSSRIQALQALLDYTQDHRDRELSYTVQWRVAGESELHTSYFSAGNILMALDKFFAGRDPHTVQVFSVMLNPVS